MSLRVKTRALPILASRKTWYRVKKGRERKKKHNSSEESVLRKKRRAEYGACFYIPLSRREDEAAPSNSSKALLRLWECERLSLRSVRVCAWERERKRKSWTWTHYVVTSLVTMAWAQTPLQITRSKQLLHGEKVNKYSATAKLKSLTPSCKFDMKTQYIELFRSSQKVSVCHGILGMPVCFSPFTPDLLKNLTY